MRDGRWLPLGIWFGLAMACEPIAGGGMGDTPDDASDCRLAAFACAPGFLCTASGVGWSCVPARGDARVDGGPPDDASIDTVDPQPSRDGGPDAAEFEAVDAAPPPERNGPGGACAEDVDCRVGRCVADPGGRCLVGCATDADCGPDAACVTEVDGEPTCVERCADAPCRANWVCADLDDRPVCLPDCALVGCRDGLECRIDGVCAPYMCTPVAERCDGIDDDCDDVVDEDAPCGVGSRCRSGRCRALAGPAEACNQDDDCANATCLPPADAPGGFCFERCLDDADCGPDAICALEAGDGTICGQPCDIDPCRPGWVCMDWSWPFVCVPRCDSIGCEAGLVCRDDGFCDWPRVRITVTQVFIAPTKLNGNAWDGFGSPPAGAIEGAAVALGAANPIAALLGVLGPDILGAYDAPDPYGTATLTLNGDDDDIRLAEFPDTFVPAWGGVTWRDVPLTPDVDLRLQIRLTDGDLLNDDPIGTVSLNAIDIADALLAGGVFPVRVDRQGAPILLVAISVVEQR